MNELEAKYLLQQGSRRSKVLRRALQELSWAGFLAHPQGTSRIHDIYYDTADARLQRAGWSLRSRIENGTFQLTCKQLSNPQSGVFSRQELEQTVSHMNAAHLTDDRTQIPRGIVTELLRSILPRDAELAQLFALNTRRTRYRLSSLELPRSHVELAVDQTRITADDELSFVEIEAELKQGPPALLREVNFILESQPQLVCARVSKFQRGLQTADCLPVDRQRDQLPPLTRESAWADLGIRHLATQSRALREMEPMAWEGVHIEGVHLMRVSVRRIRAALKAFSGVLSPEGGEALQTESRWLGQRLGSVRDLDVQLEHLDSYAKVLHPDDQRLLGRYRQLLLKDRNRAHARLRNAFAGQRFTRLERSLQQYLERSETDKMGFEFRSVEEMAREYVRPQLKKILKRGRTITRHSPAERLHRLRIEIKRLRYQLEFLREPYGRDLKQSTRRLRNLQNTLGDHQDACVAREQLTLYRSHHELGKQENRIFKHLLVLEAEKASRCHRQFFKDWKKFEREAEALKALFR
jgi:CHAD domain-containing protein/uncharacterized protein YjbK